MLLERVKDILDLFLRWLEPKDDILSFLDFFETLDLLDFDLDLELLQLNLVADSTVLKFLSTDFDLVNDFFGVALFKLEA